MATRIESRRGVIDAERRFFLISAWVMAGVIVAGFSARLASGRSSFSLPLIYHIHAFVFFGWVALYLLQTGLVAAGNVRLHRRLGWLAAGWVPVMVALGTILTIVSLRTHGGPPFFDANEFLVQNILGVLYFAGFAAAAIGMRRRTDWHRRLMYCGMASLTGPGLGRLLPMPLFIPWAWWVNQFFVALFPIVGILADQHRHGRVHRAYWWGMGLFVAVLIGGDLFAYSPPGIALTRAVMAGTPGDRADLHAHMP